MKELEKLFIDKIYLFWQPVLQRRSILTGLGLVDHDHDLDL